MQFAIVLLLAVGACVSAYQASRSARSAFTLFAKSKALPFLEAPAKLDGSMVGDVGFDPMGITNTLASTKYVQAAEIKHGRVAMLATVGFIIQQKFHFLTSEADPLKAITALGYGPNLQILSFIGVIELATWNKTFCKDSTPGDLGFDPMGQLKGKNQKFIDDMKLKEIKNSRLAMVAIIGMIVQNLTFHTPTL
jgi:hypothetical protein